MDDAKNLSIERLIDELAAIDDLTHSDEEDTMNNGLSENTHEETLAQATDHFSWFKETFVFSDDDLQSEVLAQIELLRETNPAEADAFSKAIEGREGEEALFRVKKAITEVAMLFSGALAIPEQAAFNTFAAKVLAESENEDRFSSRVRNTLLTGVPNEAREDVREQLKTQFPAGSKELRKAEIQYDMRLDNFIDAYRKQQNARQS
jgi:hypothetical protein